ncbi:MAG: AAA family ATPase [Caldilineaceae bacterium SB0670_bin_27]|nr:AAA family ATPase [Caldilineaceae bacterium SB0670_bin_27]
MTISKIRIANFKSFADETVELNDFNLLVGANASGKSNFVQAFKFLSDIAAHGLEDAISLQGGVEYLRHFGSAGDEPLLFQVTIQGESQEVDYGVDVGKRSDAKPTRQVSIRMPQEIISMDYEFSLRFHKGGYSVERDKLTLCHDPGIPTESRRGSSAYAKTIAENSSGKLIVNSTVPNMEHLSSFGGEHIAERTLLFETPILYLFAGTFVDWFKEIGIYDIDPKRAKEIITVAGRSELETDGGNLALVLKNLLGDEDTRRSIRNLCQYNLPYLKDLKIEQLADRFLSIKVQETFVDGSELPAFLISDGTANIIALIVALYFQEQKRFAIFEEPERHLHPKLISGLMELFKEASSKRQILLTSHNPEVVKNAGIENLLLVSRDKSGFSRIVKPSDSQLVRTFLENELGVEELFVDKIHGV